MVKGSLLFFALLFVLRVALGQSDFKQQYFNGKNFFREGQYNLAMEAFKQAIPYDNNNPFSEYASFYYALSAYRQGYLSVARDQLAQIKKLYPSWDKMDEVNFWLGKIYMDNREYFQGLNIWETVKNPGIKKDITGVKEQSLSGIEDVETLRMMLEEHPNDQIVAHALAGALSKKLDDTESRIHLEALIKRFGFERSDFINEAPPTYFKDTYSVSLLFPFMVSTLDPTPGRKRNQLILDLYEGMKLAADTLGKMGAKISLRAYDTERKTSTIKKILATEELKNTDLLIGPFFPEENALVQDFSMTNRINMFQPFTNNIEMVDANQFGFLLQPSYETLGRKSAEFLASYVKRRKNCIVYYGTSKRDSTLAASFIQKATEQGLKIVHSKRLTKDETGSIITTLATPTEFDEWKVPIQFTLKTDSLGSIFVASDDALIYTKVISSVETRRDSIVVVGSENWLDQTAVDLEKYQTLNVVFAAPNYTSAANRFYKAFTKKYIRVHGQAPSGYAKMGYELMLFTGNLLKKYGVYFQDVFDEDKKLVGYLSEGYNYQFSHDNQFVPFVKFEQGELTMIKK
ncbi:MAG TPA: hypothetical protein VFW11_06955 [Cyclobacteriaceae bacterium]|nr:hypothetical protein [Cyclobacteriaceae bacterium]